MKPGNAPCMHVDGEHCPKCWITGVPPKKDTITFDHIQEALSVLKEHGISAIEIQEQWDKQFWRGFDACLEMVLSLLDQYESNELAKLSVYEFIEKFRDDICEESSLHKKDG